MAVRTGPSPPPRRDETRGVVEFEEVADLAAAQGENVDEIRREGTAGLGDLARVMSENEHPVGCGVEFLRVELGKLLLRRDAGKELPDPGGPVSRRRAGDSRCARRSPANEYPASARR